MVTLRATLVIFLMLLQSCYTILWGKIETCNVSITQVIITFSLSVLISFLSSLFFNFPGASAMGREVWKMKSLPAHSAACRKASATVQVRNIQQNCKGDWFKNKHSSILITPLLSCRKALCQTHWLSNHLVTSVVSTTAGTAHCPVTEKQVSVLLDLC